MSRTGKQPVSIPKEIKITLQDNSITVASQKNKLELNIPSGILIELNDNILLVKRQENTKQLRSLHGTIRVLINNMVKGVTEGFKKELEIIGVGYKAQIKGKDLILNLGFSHPVEMAVPEDLNVSTPSTTRVVVEGIDKQKVGEFAAKVRRIYPPEPYKGKGVRYSGEIVRKKLGKALAK